jgi:hypothetical protein
MSFLPRTDPLEIRTDPLEIAFTTAFWMMGLGFGGLVLYGLFLFVTTFPWAELPVLLIADLITPLFEYGWMVGILLILMLAGFLLFIISVAILMTQTIHEQAKQKEGS